MTHVGELFHGEQCGLSGVVGARRALAAFCFDHWVMLRGEEPAVAEGFYGLSQQLCPTLTVPGSLPMRVLMAVLGARKTEELRQRIGGAIAER